MAFWTAAWIYHNSLTTRAQTRRTAQVLQHKGAHTDFAKVDFSELEVLNAETHPVAATLLSSRARQAR